MILRVRQIGEHEMRSGKRYKLSQVVDNTAAVKGLKNNCMKWESENDVDNAFQKIGEYITVKEKLSSTC